MVFRWPNPSAFNPLAQRIKITFDNRFSLTVGAAYCATAQLALPSNRPPGSAVWIRLLFDRSFVYLVRVWRFPTRWSTNGPRSFTVDFGIAFEMIIYRPHRRRSRSRWLSNTFAVNGSCFPRGRAKGRRIINSARQQVSTFRNQHVRKLPCFVVGGRGDWKPPRAYIRIDYPTTKPIQVSITGTLTFRAVSNGHVFPSEFRLGGSRSVAYFPCFREIKVKLSGSMRKRRKIRP